MRDQLIESLNTIAKFESTKREKGWQFKVAMYRKAMGAFKRHEGELKTWKNAEDVLSGTFKDAKKITAKVKELYDTGKIAAVERIKNNPEAKAIEVLSSVPHIGPVKAQKLVREHGITTVSQLKSRGDLLTKAQIVGVKYYNNLIDPKTLNAKRIPRNEIARFDTKLQSVIKGYELEFTISGSYRRGMMNSGDVDVLFTGNKTDFPKIVKQLQNESILVDVLTSGPTKWMGFGKIDTIPRRIDLMYISKTEYPFAIMYFTGSKEFNEAFRGYARKLGFTLNEHRIEKLNGSPVQYKFSTEADIFTFLKVPFIPPTKRNYGMFTLPILKENGKMSSIKIRDKVQCLKGEGAGGYTLNKVKGYAEAMGVDTNGKKKDICNRLFPSPGKKGNFNVSKGVLLAKVYENTVNPVGYYISEKYDGIRAVWDGKQLKSRTNKKIEAPMWFIQQLPSGVPLDGELYIGRGLFEQTASIVSKKSPINSEWKRIKYYVFDLPLSSEPFNKRYEQLKELVTTQCKKDCVMVVPKHSIVGSRGEMKQMFENVVAKGGEGVMLRRANSKYVQKRSSDLLKVKPTDDAEAIITGMIEGKGKDAGTMGALQVVLKGDTSKAFKIGTGFSAENRRTMWATKDKLIGTMVTFGYKGLTAKGIPRHPAFMRIRANAAI